MKIENMQPFDEKRPPRMPMRIEIDDEGPYFVSSYDTIALMQKAISVYRDLNVYVEELCYDDLDGDKAIDFIIDAIRLLNRDVYI